MSNFQQSFFDKYARGQGASQSGQGSQSGTNGYTPSPVGPTINPNNSQPSIQHYQIEGRSSERLGDTEGYLKWASTLTNNTVISGSSDYSQLANLKDAILELRTQYFNPKSGLSVKGGNSDQFERRFLLIEHEIDGLLRRRIEYSTKDHVTGERNLDYTSYINEKENQIVELEKKIQNLEERLRRAGAREIELENKIVALKAETLQLKGYSGNKLDEAIKREKEYDQAQLDLKNLRETFSSTVGIWLKQLNGYRSKYPNDKWDLDASISERLRDSRIQAITVNDFTFLQVHTDKTVEVPVQDTRTKHLIHLLATNLKKLAEKYPKITTELNAEIVELFQQGVIDTIEVDQLDRLIEIVRFVPQSVRVENVYAYSSSKSRRVEFHLRVLLKALLEELEKLRARYGAVLEIDEGVIGMINQEIMGVVNVDDILKVFRVVPKIVEVERIIEKIVEREVEVPKVIPVEKYVEKIVEVPKYVEVEKIIHKPVEVVKVVDSIVEKFVEVPTIEEKIVEVCTLRDKLVPVEKEVAKVIEVEKIVKQIVVNTQIKEIEKPINHVFVTKEAVNIVKEVPVTVEVIREVIKEVEVIVERIVPVEVIKVELVEVEKIVEKVIKEIQYVTVNQTEVAVKEKIVEVPVYIEKIVPVETIVTRILNVPTRIEVPVAVKEVQTVLKPIEITVEKFFERIVPREIEKIVNHVVEKEVQVIKEVERIVQVPILQDRIVTVTVEIPKVVIERVHVPHIVPVKCIEEKIIEKPKIIEIEKPYIQYIKDIQVVNCVVEKIVEVPKIVERIKEVRVRVEKIVNKLVEVPKVVEVEKIVEKIVVVPRIVEVPVEVPQIIEVPVERIVKEVEIQIVQRIVEKIVTVDRPVEVEKIKNVYIQVDRPVDRWRETPVPVEKIIESKEIVEIYKDKLIPVVNQVPVEIFIDKVVPVTVDSVKVIEVEKPTTLIIEVPQIIDRRIEVPVEVPREVAKEVYLVEKIEIPVAVETTRTEIKQVQSVVEKVVKVSEPQVYTETVVKINEKFTAVPEIVEKIQRVNVPSQPQAPKVVDRYIQKVVEVIRELPKVVGVQLQTQVAVEKVEVVELEKVVNHIETEHKVVTEYIDRIVKVPTYEQRIVEKPTEYEKIVEVKTIETVLKPETQFIEKIVQKDTIEVVNNTVPYYEKKVEVVDRFEKVQVPAFTTQERILQVPQFQEKIVERLIVMPQVVEVLKYVTEIVENDTLAVGVSVDIIEQEKRFKELYGVSKRQLEIVIVELRKLRTSQPQLAGLIELLERYLIDFDRLAAVQRIVPVDREKIVEKEVSKAVLVPTKDSETIKSELAHALLIEKLILELKRIKKESPATKFQLDNDVSLFFFTELYDQPNFTAAGNFQESLSNYTKESLTKLKAFGGEWATDHELILSTILQDRFSMAALVNQANIEVEKAKAISTKNATTIKDIENKWLPLQKLIKDKQESLNRLLNNNPSFRNNSELVALARDFDSIVAGSIINFEPLRVLDSEFTVGTGTNWSRAVSRIHELELNVTALQGKLLDVEKNRGSVSSVDNSSKYTIQTLRDENDRLARELDNYKRNASLAQSSSSQNAEFELRIRTSASRIQELELQLKTSNSRIADLESQLRTSQIRVQELESQLKQAKDVASSAASETNKLVDSKYSSSSSNNTFTRTTYEAPNYSNSQYTAEYSSGLGGSGVKPTSTYGQGAGTSYGTAGTLAYQTSGSSKLISSGVQGTTGATFGTSYGTTGNTTNYTTESNNTYGTTETSSKIYQFPTSTSTLEGQITSKPVTAGLTRLTDASGTTLTGGKGGATLLSGSSSSGAMSSSGTYTSPLNTYGTTGGYTSGATGGYTSGATGGYTSGTGATYGTAGISNQYGASITTGTVSGIGASSSFTSNVTSSLSGSGLSGSGMKQSGTSYTFQTKKI